MKTPALGRSLSIAALVFGLIMVRAGVAGEKISQAENLLFETDHLGEINQPVLLHYDFRKAGSLEPGYQDSVEIAIRSVAPSGAKAVSTRYLSGERRRSFPPVPQARGNPVLLYFLERDIHEMQRLTGGNWHYFQKRIRLALADKAQIRPISFVYENKELKGQEVRITPYVDDPNKSRYGEFADKFYVFVLSNQVPGGVYQIRAVVPNKKAGEASPALLDETLTFTRTSRS